MRETREPGGEEEERKREELRERKRQRECSKKQKERERKTEKDRESERETAPSPAYSLLCQLIHLCTRACVYARLVYVLCTSFACAFCVCLVGFEL